jgi:sporulation protein YlmC with PRC-barrel domain
MATMEDIRTWRGRTLVDRDGDKIGKVEDIYLDRSSGEPEWIAVKTGMFGSNVTFVPIHDASPAGDDLRVSYEKGQVKDAPNVDPDGELSPEEERRLYEHYSRANYDEWTADSEDRTEAAYGRDTREDRDFDDDDTATGDSSGPTTDDAMTRSEHALRVGTQRRETGRARLRKYVETENVTEDRPGAARGGSRRARADYRGQPRRRAGRPGHLRDRARCGTANGGARRREAHRAQGARPPRQGRPHRRADRQRGPP